MIECTASVACSGAGLPRTQTKSCKSDSSQRAFVAHAFRAPPVELDASVGREIERCQCLSEHLFVTQCSGRRRHAAEGTPDLTHSPLPVRSSRYPEQRAKAAECDPEVMYGFFVGFGRDVRCVG